jgi:hypothetical protein
MMETEPDRNVDSEALESFIKREEDTEAKFLSGGHVLISPKFRLHENVAKHF